MPETDPVRAAAEAERRNAKLEKLAQSEPAPPAKPKGKTSSPKEG